MDDPPSREETLLNAIRALGAPERVKLLNELRAAEKALHLQIDQAPDGITAADVSADKTASTLEAEGLFEGPGTIVGRYKLLQKLGEGGMGSVWMAVQGEPVRRRVALKLIKLGMDTKNVVARFEAERQALALMDHSRIAKVLDAGATQTGRPYFVMELVQGVPITRYCDDHQVSTEERLKLFISVCQAIQHAHQKGVIHRDIKPSNVLVSLHEGTPSPKVIDFGVAKAIAGQQLTDKTLFTAIEQFIGTPAYISPEQAEMSTQDIDTRSDIYGLGVLLYELLVGRTPFDPKELLRSGLDAMRRTIREKEPVRPSTRLRSLSDEERTTTAKRQSTEAPKLIGLLRGDLDWIVIKCLEKDRTHRYETANGLALDIQRHLSSEPVVARPPSKAYLVQKFVRRNKIMVAAVAVVIAVLILGVFASSWEAVRADQAAKAAVSERERAERGEKKAKESDFATQQSLYAADMSLAYRAWQDNNLLSVLELLNKHLPTAGQPDLRGWEWRYLWGACRSDELSNFTTLSYSVDEVAVSRDGKIMATAGRGSRGGGVTLWEISSNKLLVTPEANDGGGSVAFSPDGKLLAYGTAHHGIKLWDIAQNKEVYSFPGKHFDWNHRGLAFSPDGHTLAAYQDANEIVLWNLQNNKPQRTLAGPEDGASSLVFLPDGQTLVSANYDSVIRLWSVTSGEELHCFTNHTSWVQRVNLSPDGKTLASASWDNTVRIWDLNENRQLKVLTNHTSWVSSLAFSPDGKTLASGGADYTIRLWDTTSWKEICTLRGSLDEIWSLAFSPDGSVLYSGAKDSNIKAWDDGPRNRKSPVLTRPQDAHEFRIDSGMTWAWNTNGTLTVWDSNSLRMLGRYALPPDGILTNTVVTALSGGGDRLALATKQGAIFLWDLARSRQVARFPWIRTESDVRLVPNGVIGAMSANGKWLCFVAASRLTVWNLQTFEEVATFPRSEAGPKSLCFANSNELMALGTWDGAVEVWDLARKERLSLWKAHQQETTGVAFMPNDKMLLTSGADARLKLWDIQTQREAQRFERAQSSYDTVAVSRDGMRVAASCWNKHIRIWNTMTRQEVATLPGTQGLTRYLAFLSDGNTLVSGSDEEVRLWRAPSWKEIPETESKGNAQLTRSK
jgi:WD40 repeat protein/serine/threonine protein kinase